MGAPCTLVRRDVSGSGRDSRLSTQASSCWTRLRRGLFCSSSRLASWTISGCRTSSTRAGRSASLGAVAPAQGGPRCCGSGTWTGPVVRPPCSVPTMTPDPAVYSVACATSRPSRCLRDPAAAGSAPGGRCPLDGHAVASIWRAEDGSVFLPVRSQRAVESFWTERYLEQRPAGGVSELRRGLMLAYYRVGPLLPRPLQIWLRRRFARLQARSTFPRWPVETCSARFLRR